MEDKQLTNFKKLIQIMRRLRKECPWDREQTAGSLRQYIIEEAFEVVEAIDDAIWPALKEELGDLLLQIIFQGIIAEEQNYFSISDIIEAINYKLTQRHPHVFGDTKANSAEEVANNWEHIKIHTEKRTSILQGVPKQAPALLQAQRLQEKASRVNFDWQHIHDVVQKMDEEVKELKDAISDKNKENIEEELGDILFSIVNVSRFLNIVAEDALRESNKKFIKRFRHIEEHYNHDIKRMKDADLKDLDKIWNKAKDS